MSPCCVASTLGARVFSVCVAPHAWNAFVASAFRPTPRIEAQARPPCGTVATKEKPRCNTDILSSTGFSLCAVLITETQIFPCPMRVRPDRAPRLLIGKKGQPECFHYF